MKLTTVVFYQSVRLWDNSEYKTVTEAKEGVEIDLRDGIVTLYKPGERTLIIVPTANMRLATIDKGDGGRARQAVETLVQLAAKRDHFEIGQHRDITKEVTGQGPSDEVTASLVVTEVNMENKSITLKKKKNK